MMVDLVEAALAARLSPPHSAMWMASLIVAIANPNDLYLSRLLNSIYECAAYRSSSSAERN